MNYYMIYAEPVPEEGAFLVFAHTAKEAKKTGYSYVTSLMGAEYKDVAVRRLRYAHWLLHEADQDKLRRDEPHVIDNPKSCKNCLYWGHSPIGTDGLCEECRACSSV